MKNICKNLFVLFAMLTATTIIASAQSTNKTEKAPAAKQDVTQQASTEKFFNISSLDDLKSTIDAAYTNYKQAPADKSDALHFDYLKAKRLYTVELEKQMSTYSKESVTGQKIRNELKRITTTE